MKRTAAQAVLFKVVLSGELEMQAECLAGSLRSIQHWKQDVNHQHVRKCPAQGEGHSQRVQAGMCVVAELRSNEGSALVVAYPAEASVRADPTPEAACLSHLVALEKQGPYENPETDPCEGTSHACSGLLAYSDPPLKVEEFAVTFEDGCSDQVQHQYSNDRV